MPVDDGDVKSTEHIAKAKLLLSVGDCASGIFLEDPELLSEGHAECTAHVEGFTNSKNNPIRVVSLHQADW